jgi:hypothetical protein
VGGDGCHRGDHAEGEQKDQEVDAEGQGHFGQG